ncbi:MAG TPA: OsmC family protein, partial [Kofleriaceae bacterium]
HTTERVDARDIEHTVWRIDPSRSTVGFEVPVLGGLMKVRGGFDRYDGTLACSGDMLLEALVACAGVTLRAGATALSIPVRGGTVSAEGDLDFRGTLGVAKDAPVGFCAIRLRFELDSDAAPDQLARLIELTERYCVIYQTLRHPPSIALEPVAP